MCFDLTHVPVATAVVVSLFPLCKCYVQQPWVPLSCVKL